MRKKPKLVYGVGTNDADYYVQSIVNGICIRCPFYRKWSSMLKRCYSSKYHLEHPSYIDCTVCDKWLTFSNFKKWMETQGWEGKELDKDILIEGNKLYSHETCLFVTQATNNLLTDSRRSRGAFPIGVSRGYKGYQTGCRSGSNNKYLGEYSTPEEAHAVYVGYKAMVITLHASKLTDKRVAAALIRRSNSMMAGIKEIR